jgi:hypothetical protein
MLFEGFAPDAKGVYLHLIVVGDNPAEKIFRRSGALGECRSQTPSRARFGYGALRPATNYLCNKALQIFFANAGPL